MGFYGGDSEDHLAGVIRNLKLEVNPYWRGPQISVGLPAWLRQVLAKCLSSLLWWVFFAARVVFIAFPLG